MSAGITREVFVSLAETYVGEYSADEIAMCLDDSGIVWDKCARPGCDDGTDVCALHRDGCSYPDCDDRTEVCSNCYRNSDDSDTDTCDGLSLDAAGERSRGV